MAILFPKLFPYGTGGFSLWHHKTNLRRDPEQQNPLDDYPGVPSNADDMDYIGHMLQDVEWPLIESSLCLDRKPGHVQSTTPPR